MSQNLRIPPGDPYPPAMGGSPPKSGYKFRFFIASLLVVSVTFVTVAIGWWLFQITLGKGFPPENLVAFAHIVQNFSSLSGRVGTWTALEDLGLLTLQILVLVLYVLVIIVVLVRWRGRIATSLQAFIQEGRPAQGTSIAAQQFDSPAGFGSWQNPGEQVQTYAATFPQHGGDAELGESSAPALPPTQQPSPAGHAPIMRSRHTSLDDLKRRRKERITRGMRHTGRAAVPMQRTSPADAGRREDGAQPPAASRVSPPLPLESAASSPEEGMAAAATVQGVVSDPSASTRAGVPLTTIPLFPAQEGGPEGVPPGGGSALPPSAFSPSVPTTDEAPGIEKRIKIHLLGGLRVFLDGQPVRIDNIGQRALLVYIATFARTNATAIASDSILEDVIGPVHQGHLKQQQDFFHKHSAQLRKKLGDIDLLDNRRVGRDGSWWWLSENCEVVDLPRVEQDWNTVRNALKSVDTTKGGAGEQTIRSLCETLLQDYAGDYLAGNYMDLGSWGYERFEHYRRMYLRSLWKIAEIDRGAGERAPSKAQGASLFQKAALSYEMYALHAPDEEYSEAALRMGIRMYVLGGEKQPANQLYHNYVDKVRRMMDEKDWEPEQKTVKVWREYTQGNTQEYRLLQEHAPQELSDEKNEAPSPPASA